MAEYNSFTYDEIKSSDFGVYIGGEKTFDAPSLRGQSIEIPGRNGNVFISSDSYENVELVYPSFNFEPDLETFRSKLAKLRNALSSRASYKRLTDTLHPDEFRMAVFRDGFEVKPIKYNTAAEFDIVFDCKPQRFLKSGEIPVEYTPGQTPSDEQTKTGSIVTFEAEEGTIISDVKADINPVQDLHGYDKPWAGGNGKNLLPYAETMQSWGAGSSTSITNAIATIIGSSSNWNGALNSALYPIALYDGSRFVLSFDIKTNATCSVQIMIAATNSAVGTAHPVTRTKYVSWGLVTLPNTNGEWQRFSMTSRTISLSDLISGSGGTNAGYIQVYARSDTTIEITKPQLEKSDTATTFEPYSNICPISGWDRVKVTRTGKNLLPCEAQSTTASNVVYMVNADGSVKAVGTAQALNQGVLNYGHASLNAGTYIINGCPSGGEAGTWRVRLGNGSYTGTEIATDTGSGATFTLTEKTDVYVRLYVQPASGAVNFTFYPMIRVSTNTDATYEQYNGNTYTIDLKGKRYGGTLDVTSGVLKVCPYYASYNGETLTGEWISDRDEYSPNTSPTIGAQVVNIGGSLITVQLTPTEVKTLLGTNNIWADSGDITVKYGTNPYIIVNPTDFPSKPLLEVTGVGSFWLGDTQITITGTSGHIIYIDCETGECYKVTGGIISPANGLVTLNRLDFPKLASGINNIQLGAGISKVKITPRWWRL